MLFHLGQRLRNLVSPEEKFFGREFWQFVKSLQRQASLATSNNRLRPVDIVDGFQRVRIPVQSQVLHLHQEFDDSSEIVMPIPMDE